MGDDFTYKGAAFDYRYLDKFIKVVESHYKSMYGQSIKVHYSTVNEYFKDVKEYNEGNLKFPEYKSDFLPYVQYESGTYDHWVGYYSSTPVLKHMIRDLFQQIRAIKVVFFLALKSEYQNEGSLISGQLDDYYDKIHKFEQEASIMMHHDAITSTSPTRTLVDYMNRIRKTETDIENAKFYEPIIFKYGSLHNKVEVENLKDCKLITVVNPIGYARTEFANITVSSPYVRLYDPEGRKVEKSQVYIEHLTKYNKDQILFNIDTYILVFEVTVPAFSVSKFFYKETISQEH